MDPNLDNTRTLYDLIDVIQHTLNGFAADLAGSGPGDVFAAEQEVAEVRRHVAELEAKNERLRIRAEAREAQLRHALRQLKSAGLPMADMKAVFDELRAKGAVSTAATFSDNDNGLVAAVVVVTEGRGAEVDAAMVELGMYPVHEGVDDNGVETRGYASDGTPPWETDAAGGAK